MLTGRQNVQGCGCGALVFVIHLMIVYAALGCRKRFLELLVELLVAELLVVQLLVVELHALVVELLIVLLVADPE